MTLFQSYRDSIIVKDHVKAKHINVGEYTYYAGYYHGGSFDDCVMYLDANDNTFADSDIDRLTIGKFCSIASGVKFMMGGTQGHNYSWIANYPFDFLDDDFDGYKKVQPKGHKRKGDTVVGNDVWLGVDALVMPGVHIADGAVIGSRAVVTKPVGPYEIWVGNPARMIKKRFSDEDIALLLKIKWWDWDLQTIKENLDLIRSRDVDALWQRVQSLGRY